MSRMKWAAVIAVAVATVVSALFVSGQVFAQHPAPVASPEAIYGGSNLPGPAMLSPVSKLLGMTTDELVAQLQQGKTLLQIAQSKGVSQEQLVTTIIGPQQDYIQSLVKNGYITQQQADARLQSLKDSTLQAIQTPWTADGTPGQGYGPWNCPAYGLNDGDETPPANGTQGTYRPGPGFGGMMGRGIGGNYGGYGMMGGYGSGMMGWGR